jgi:hypothetical protein
MFGNFSMDYLIIHHPVELSNVPVIVDPTVNKLGKLVIVPAHHTCWPTVSPVTVVPVIFK